MAAAFAPSESIEDFIPAAVLLLSLDGMAAAATARSEGWRSAGAARAMEAVWSLIMALAIALRPVYSILTLSFVLLLQLLLWMTGLGAIRMTAALGRPYPASSDEPERRSGRTPVLVGRSTPAAEIAGGASLLLASLALHIFPGAGAVDRRQALGAILLLVGLLDCLRLVGPRRTQPSGPDRGRIPSERDSR